MNLCFSQKSQNEISHMLSPSGMKGPRLRPGQRYPENPRSGLGARDPEIKTKSLSLKILMGNPIEILMGTAMERRRVLRPEGYLAQPRERRRSEHFWTCDSDLPSLSRLPP